MSLRDKVEKLENEKAKNLAEEAAITEPKKTAEGWHKFGNYWFLLDAVTQFKETDGSVSEINGCNLGIKPESYEPLGYVLSVLEEHARQQKGGKNSIGNLPPSSPMPLPSAPTPKGSQRPSLG